MKVLGYVYDSNGTHGDCLKFEGNPENIANFIMFNMMNPCIVTDELDQFIVSSTVGGFLDRVSSPMLREEILEKILPLQLGDKEPFNPVEE